MIHELEGCSATDRPQTALHVAGAQLDLLDRSSLARVAILPGLNPDQIAISSASKGWERASSGNPTLLGMPAGLDGLDLLDS